jgi:hypothetical protein
MNQSTAPERRPQTINKARAQLLRIADALLLRSKLKVKAEEAEEPP